MGEEWERTQELVLYNGPLSELNERSRAAYSHADVAWFRSQVYERNDLEGLGEELRRAGLVGLVNMRSIPTPDPHIYKEGRHKRSSFSWCYEGTPIVSKATDKD